MQKANISDCSSVLLVRQIFDLGERRISWLAKYCMVDEVSMDYWTGSMGKIDTSEIQAAVGVSGSSYVAGTH